MVQCAGKCERGGGRGRPHPANRLRWAAGQAGVLLGLLVLLGGCHRPAVDYFQGYLEGEYLYVASPLAGTLTHLAVTRGQVVPSGQGLFDLEREAEAAGVREAEQRLVQTQARLANLSKGLRPSEIDALQAQRDRAQASLRLSQTELDRRLQLVQNQVIATEELDAIKARRDADLAQVAVLKAELETARLGGRADEVRAAEAEMQATAAALSKAQWALAQKSQSAPTNGWIHDTLYREGEFVAAGNPVVSLLPLENIKARFFVPEAQLASVKFGQVVSVSFDGANAPLRATVNYIATQAEFTPPVIYSKENRAKLVFMVEAVFAPADARNLRPGQPVDVRLNP